MVADNKRIAKNTLILYGRMIITMLVGFYTSRIILQNLGVDDYGIYGVVGGIVGFMGFLNAALATSSSRFLTYALGRGILEESKKTFSTTLSIHVILGLIILAIGEIIGPWMIECKLIIPEDRLFAAHVAFQLSLVTTVIGVSQVPYSATIVAHEKMDIYAYMAIVDVVVRLAIALSLNWWGGDKLIFFAALLCLQSIGIMVFYRFYCAVNFQGSTFSLHIDKKIFREIAGFSIWSLVQSFVNALTSSGTTILIGMFFVPAIVAGKSISLRIGQMTTQFIGNFRQAMNPQIVKLYANGEYDEFRKLTLRSGLYSFFIMWITVLPICMVADQLLVLWLGAPPETAAKFSILQLLSTLFWLFDASFQQGIVATGDIKKSTIYSSIINGLMFPVIYIIFKLDGDVFWSLYVSIIFGAIVGCWLKPWLLIKQAGFHWVDFIPIYMQCIKVVVVSVICPFALYYLMLDDTLVRFFMIGGTSVISAGLSIYFIGLEKTVRQRLTKVVLKKIRNR